MSDDGDFMNNWTGAGQGSTSPVINPSGGAYCDYSSIPEAKVKTVEVKFEYEAWFTGDISAPALALGAKNVNSKLLGYLASSANLCDGLECTANTADCKIIFNTAVNTDGGIVGISKNSTDIVQTKYVCEQPKPVKQLPLFNQIVCIPVSSSILVTVPSKFTSTQVQTYVWNSIKNAMDTGDLNTPNQVVGLVFTETPHTKLNVSGTIKKEMRPLGKGLLSFGIILLAFIIAGLVTWRIIKRRRNHIENDDDLSMHKDEEEESYAPTDSFMSEDVFVPSPTNEAAPVEKTHSIARKESEVSRYSVYPPTKGPSVVTTSNASVRSTHGSVKSTNKSEPHVQATDDEEFEKPLTKDRSSGT